MNKLLKITFLLSFLLFLGACSSNKAVDVGKTNHKASRQVNVLKLDALQSLSAITPRLAQHRVVFVGETHTSYSDHLNQLNIIKELHKKWGSKLSIGLEMIQTPYQAALNAYIAGKLSERDMLQATEWYDRWKFDFRLYRPIFKYAKRNHIPLIALNIPSELTKKITKVGIKGLTKTERAKLPAVIDRSNTIYTQRIKDVFMQHRQTSSKGFDKFLDAQLAWDEGMAFSAANYLEKNLSRRLIIITGNGHIINRDGIPNRLERLLKSKPVVVLSNYQGAPNKKQADYSLFNEEQELPPIGLIGIHMKASAKHKGVIVAALSKRSAAKKAGIKKDDVIIELDKQSVSDVVDIRLLLENKRPDDVINIRVRRKSKIITFKVKLGRRMSFGF